MSDLVLSNLTIQGHPVGLFYDEPEPEPVTPSEEDAAIKDVLMNQSL